MTGTQSVRDCEIQHANTSNTRNLQSLTMTVIHRLSLTFYYYYYYYHFSHFNNTSAGLALQIDHAHGVYIKQSGESRQEAIDGHGFEMGLLLSKDSSFVSI